MSLQALPEGLVAAGAAVESLTARLAAAQAVAAAATTTVLPPAVDPVSLQAAVSLSAKGVQHGLVAVQGSEELGRSGVGVGESGISYATGDAQAALSYLTARGGL